MWEGLRIGSVSHIMHSQTPQISSTLSVTLIDGGIEDFKTLPCDLRCGALNSSMIVERKPRGKSVEFTM